MNKIKVIANYLPQYHIIPENSKWWGDGFTDWVAVKNSVPLYEGHNQPRVPLDNHYYSLDQVAEIRWQAEIANKFGVYGFGIYHYWFSSDLMLLQKPAEIIRDNEDINIHYLFLWDNSSWRRTWSKGKCSHDWAPNFDEDKAEEQSNSGMLAEVIYGTKKDWKKHFLYLLTFFKDERYIKMNNKPIFGFFQPHNDFHTIKKMVAYWDELAKNAGFNGIICMTRENWRNEHLEYRLRYAPFSTEYLKDAVFNKMKVMINQKCKGFKFCNYDLYWKEILKNARKAKDKSFLSGFVDYDDSPRRGPGARIMTNGTPDKFERYVYELMKISKDQAKEYVFITAWNEWGEGAYLEPDAENGYAYLEGLKRSIDNINNSNFAVVKRSINS